MCRVCVSMMIASAFYWSNSCNFNRFSNWKIWNKIVCTIVRSKQLGVNALSLLSKILLPNFVPVIKKYAFDERFMIHNKIPNSAYWGIIPFPLQKPHTLIKKQFNAIMENSRKTFLCLQGPTINKRMTELQESEQKIYHDVGKSLRKRSRTNNTAGIW